MKDLVAKAHAAGVQTSYIDVHGHPVHADPEALQAIADTLGTTPSAPAPDWPSDLPVRAFHPDPDRREWGIFLPHHSLQTDATRGHGDLTALGELGAWAASRGARVLGTLPLLPSFLHTGPGPYEPSPYAPISRHFWGEHLVDPTATPQWERCPEAQAILAEARGSGRLAALRAGAHIDPAGAWALQWELLSALARTARSEAPIEVDDADRLWAYAWFRAASQVRGPWPTWDMADRRFEVGVELGPDRCPDVDPELAFAWAYAQTQARAQVRTLRAKLDRLGIDLYLDLPIGTHPDGFDTWFGTGEAPLHAARTSAGAPPDPFFTNGQDWGFPPVHPRVSEATDHAELRAALRHHAELAPRLRIDHILGFYRLFWIPRGMGATRGVYVGYPAEAWWQALVETSHATRCQMIGENLGMVPPALTQALKAHGVAGMHVGQFSLQADADHPLRWPEPGDLTCLNTHDMPTFGGWWTGRDLEIQHELGWLDQEGLASERAGRQHMTSRLAPLGDSGPLAGTDAPESTRVAANLYERLARTPAGLVLVNLEDLWDEREPQNVPGTWRERPNWLRRACKSLEELSNDAHIHTVFASLRAARPTDAS